MWSMALLMPPASARPVRRKPLLAVGKATAADSVVSRSPGNLFTGSHPLFSRGDAGPLLFQPFESVFGFVRDQPPQVLNDVPYPCNLGPCRITGCRGTKFLYVTRQ